MPARTFTPVVKYPYPIVLFPLRKEPEYCLISGHSLVWLCILGGNQVYVKACYLIMHGS